MSELRPLLIRVPASTSNIGPGFDCLGLALTLPFDFEISPAEEDALELGGAAGEVKPGKTPFFKAFRAVFERAGEPAPCAGVRAASKAPIGRGFGGSGAACVAGALAANEWLGRPFGRDDLFGICLEIEGHPDNAAASLFGGLTLIARGKSRSLVHVYETAPMWKLAFLAPDYEVATPRARKALPGKITREDAVFNLSRLPLLLDALVAGDAEGLGRVMDDKLHEPHRAKLIKRSKRIRAAALEAGAAATFISGSGPSIGALCTSHETAHAVARAMLKVCAGASFTATTLLAEATTTAAQVAEL